MKGGSAGRYWRTLRHLPPAQLAWLAWRRLVRQPRRVRAPRGAAPRPAARMPAAVPAANPSWHGGHRFTFLNETRDFGDAIDWSASGASRLWQYNLHYFDWLRQPGVTCADAQAQALAWIAANPPFRGTGWEPYPVSLRLVNWMCRFAPVKAAPEVAASLALQSVWLERNLERHLRANHLFVNLKALLFAGAWFDGVFAARLRARAWALLERELDEQFLADGGHVERSPMYHLLLTADLLELTALMSRNPDLFPAAHAARVAACADRALQFARAMVHPGGELACFNDATEGIAPSLAALESYAAAEGRAPPSRSAGRSSVCLAASGYYGVRDGDDAILIDCGEIGPDYQPGHAHCDLLSFELSYDGRRLIGNCGTHDYGSGPERAYARSTRAHSTVVVDGEDQCELWGVFRVGRRAHPLGASLSDEGRATIFRGAHDGYRWLPGGVEHHREIRVGPAFELHVRDELRGRGQHTFESWLHFAPPGNVEYNGGEIRVTLEDGSGLIVRIDGAASVSLVDTPRYPGFGRTVQATSACLSGYGELPLTLAFVVARAAPSSAVRP